MTINFHKLDVVPLSINLHASLILKGVFCATVPGQDRRSSNLSAASSPSLYRCLHTVVSGGDEVEAAKTSSIPITDNSSGTAIPNSFATCKTDSASMSLEANMAVGRLSSFNSRSMGSLAIMNESDARTVNLHRVIKFSSSISPCF